MAKNIAKWGSKVFLVSPSKIIPFEGLSTGFARKSDSNNDTSGTAATNTRGLELQSIKLETSYIAAAGVDPRAELESWKKMFGVYNPLIINGKRFGPALMELDKVDFPNIVTDNKGRFLQVDASITLIEYVPPQKAKKSTSSSGGSSGGSKGSGSSLGIDFSVYSAKPSSTEKAQKKQTTRATLRDDELKRTVR